MEKKASSEHFVTLISALQKRKTQKPFPTVSVKLIFLAYAKEFLQIASKTKKNVDFEPFRNSVRSAKIEFCLYTVG